ATERSIILNKIADRIEENLEYIATVETIDNGKAIRETMNADIPLAIDHFRYFAGVIRAEEGSLSELDQNTVSLIVNEPIGVVAQDRKSTRLNSSHVKISYAVFCLKKKKNNNH